MKVTLLAILLVITSQSALAETKITLFAAASLTNALDEVNALYQQQSDNKVRTSYASSSSLARQIAGGAPADIYISANQRWMDYLDDEKTILSESRHTLLQNSLVLISQDSKAQQTDSISQLNDFNEIPALLGTDRLAVGDPDHVPAGIYAKQALQSFNLWQQLSPQLARSHNVRSALLLVERGEAPLGIVYKSDGLLSKKVRILKLFPANSHAPIEYPIAIVKGRNNPAVKQLYQFLRSPKAAEVFIKYGFSITGSQEDIHAD